MSRRIVLCSVQPSNRKKPNRTPRFFMKTNQKPNWSHILQTAHS